MKRFSALIFGVALLVVTTGTAKAVITTWSINLVCDFGNTCVAGVDQITGTITIDDALPFPSIVTSASLTPTTAQVGVPHTDPLPFDPFILQVFLVAGFPAGVSNSEINLFFVESMLPPGAGVSSSDLIADHNWVVGEGTLITDRYVGTASIVPIPAALPLFLSALAVFGFVARKRRSAAAA